MQPPKLRGLFRTDPPRFLESQTIEFPIRILIEGSKPLPPRILSVIEIFRQLTKLRHLALFEGGFSVPDRVGR